MEGSQPDIDIFEQRGYILQATHELTGCGRGPLAVWKASRVEDGSLAALFSGRVPVKRQVRLARARLGWSEGECRCEEDTANSP